MTSMFVPDPVISLAIAPKAKEGTANFSKALQKFLQRKIRRSEFIVTKNPQKRLFKEWVS